MNPVHVGWALLVAGFLLCAAFVTVTFKVGYVVGNQGAAHWRQEADSLRRLMREGICVRTPGSNRCEWMIPRDTVRGR